MPGVALMPEGTLMFLPLDSWTLSVKSDRFPSITTKCVLSVIGLHHRKSLK